MRNAEGGEGVDATQVVDDLIEIREQSMAGTTFVLGHELAHNLLDVMRRTGTLTPEREAALRERFAGKDGAFDEEAFADAFGDRLSRAFVVGQRELADTPANGVVRLLDALAGWVARIVEAVRRTRGGAARTPTDAAGAVDALVRETPVGQDVEDGMRRSGVPVDEMKDVGGENEEDVSSAGAGPSTGGVSGEQGDAGNAGEPQRNGTAQSVAVDSVGAEEKAEPVPLRADRRRELLTKIAQRKGRRFSTEEVGDDVLDAMDTLARGEDATLHSEALGEVLYPFGKTGKGGMGFLHIVERRMAQGHTLDEAVEIALRVGESAARGTVERESGNIRWLDRNDYRAIVAIRDGDSPIITGYDIWRENERSADDGRLPNRPSDNSAPHPLARKDEVVAALKRIVANNRAARQGRSFSTESVPDYGALARNGRDVTADEFVTTFGMYEPFVPGDFIGTGDFIRTSRAEGNNYDDADVAVRSFFLSQDAANAIYDAWLSLAKMFGIDPRALGLGGLVSPEISKDISSRGSFDAMNGNLGISIYPFNNEDSSQALRSGKESIEKGAIGSTAVHEWAHALDNALVRGRDADWNNRLPGQEEADALDEGRRARSRMFRGSLSGQVPGGRLFPFTHGGISFDSMRPEAREAFEKAWARILETSYGKRQKNLDNEVKERIGKDKKFAELYKRYYWDELVPYFMIDTEIFARALQGVWTDRNGVDGWRYYWGGAPIADMAHPTKAESEELFGIFRELFSALEVGVNETTGRMTLFSTESVGVLRFSETEAGKRVVARLVDNLIRHQEDLAFGNAAVQGAMEQGGNAAVGKWNRVASAGANGAESLPDTAEGLAREEKFRAFQFGRPGGEELRELVREAGSAENWLDVVGTAYEALSAVRAGNLLDGGLAEQIAKRYERSEREAVGWYVRRIVEARATDYGQKCYLMGREFAMQLMREANESALAELRAEYEDKLSAVRAERREADEARRTAERGRDRARERLRRERARQRFIDADRDLLTRWLLAEAQSEVRATRERDRAKAAEAVGEAKAQTREAKKAATAERNRADAAERALARERETSANVAWQLAEERLLSRYYEAKMKHLMEMRVRTLRDRMRETREQQALKDARKRALERERGMSFAELQGVLGFDLMARVEKAALSEEDVGALAERIVREIDTGFDKETQQGRKELWEWGTYTGEAVPLRLTKQGERAYAMTAQHILKGLARKLAYGCKRVVA